MSYYFRVLRATIPEERAAWTAEWERWPSREIFAHPGFVSLFAERASARAMAAVLTGDGVSVIYPFAFKELGPAFEITTPYAYGGPFVAGDARHAAAEFWPRFDSWAVDNRVISEFVRFSLFEEQQLAYPCPRDERLLSVVRSLDLDPSAMWMDFDHKVRKNVRTAQRAGVRVVADHTGVRLTDFMRVFTGTLDRRSASASSYFTREFFEAFHAAVPGQFIYFHAVDGDTVVSTELVLVSSENVYSFLGGTDVASYPLRPNDLLRYEIIRWAQSENKKRYVLGAGFAGLDGIFRHKLAFAPNSTVTFCTGQRVLMPDLYDALVRS